MVCCLCVSALLVGLIGIIAYVWYNKPSLIIRLLIRLPLFLSGCTVKHVDAGDINWCYAEKGAPIDGKPTMLFVHGFLLQKEMWAPVIKRIPDYHVIMVDMPGHGGTGLPSEVTDITFPGQAKLLHKFVVMTGLDRQPLHVIGMSMGGAVAAEYAAMFPAVVSQLTLVCPAMKTPTATEFMTKAMKTGKFPLLTESLEGFAHVMQTTSVKKMPQNEELLQGLLEIRMSRDSFYKRAFKAMDLSRLPEVAPKIKAPTQVIWGMQDMLVHVSGAQLLKETLANCQQYDIFENCGHTVTVDQPESLTNCLIVFRQVSS